MRKEMLVAATAIWILTAPRVGGAQIKQQGPPTQTGTTTNQSGHTTQPSIYGQSQDEGRDDANTAMREAGRVRSFANERQKKMVQDTDKLLALATELKQEMEKSNKNEMSLDVIKKADEIERLAHDVKTRMKG